ncbi:MAG: hypothetical protein U0V72_02240 [Cytophagales bacterium]
MSNFLWVYDFENNIIKIPHPDYIYYSKLAYFLNETGIESISLSPYATINPYHYFELWITAIFNVFNINYYYFLLLVTYPIFYVLTFLLAKEVYPEKAELDKNIFGVLILLSTCFCIDNLIRINDFMQGNLIFFRNAINYKKLSVIYFYLMLLFVSWRINKVYFKILVAGLPLIYPSLLFGYIGIVVGINTFNLIIKNKIEYKWLIYHFLIFLLIVIFYKLNSFNGGDVFSQFKKIEFYKTSINIMGGSLIRILILLLPFLVLIRFRNFTIELKEIFKHQLTWILFFGVLFSILGWIVFQFQLDSVQIFSNFCVCVLGILVALYLNDLKYRLGILVLILLIFLNDYNNYRISDYKIKNQLSMKSKNYAFFKPKESYNNPFTINPYFSNPIIDIFILNNKIKMYDMTIGSIEESKSEINKTIVIFKNSNEFLNYKKKYPHSTPDDFMKKFKIDALIFENIKDVPVEFVRNFKFYTKIDSYEIWVK